MSQQPVGAVAGQFAASRSDRLDRVISDLLRQTPELEAAAVVSFDSLPMAAALPATMDEDRVAAMSAALLSLGERATQSLGRGDLSQVYIEGETGTVFLTSADSEAVLVAVAAAGAKVGMMLYEVRRAAAAVADVLRAQVSAAELAAQHDDDAAGYRAIADTVAAEITPAEIPPAEMASAAPDAAGSAAAQHALQDEWMPQYSTPPAAAPVAPAQAEPLEPAAWTSYAPVSTSPAHGGSGNGSLPGEPPAWS